MANPLPPIFPKEWASSWKKVDLQQNRIFILRQNIKNYPTFSYKPKLKLDRPFEFLAAYTSPRGITGVYILWSD